jgi:hypothetical protein
MVTLTSVGYGGIAPLNPYVGMVAAFESMSGIFFIAVVVVLLVSSYNPKAKQLEPSFAAADSCLVVDESRDLESAAIVRLRMLS